MSTEEDTAGLLDERARRASDILSDCTLCPRACHVNRLENQRGFCRTGARAMVSRAHMVQERFSLPDAAWAVYSARITISAI
jgi:uncharacterized Fe-S radical SAM superfamily protein PflX